MYTLVIKVHNNHTIQKFVRHAVKQTFTSNSRMHTAITFFVAL